MAGEPMPEDRHRAVLLLDRGALLLGRALLAGMTTTPPPWQGDEIPAACASAEE